LGRLSHQVGFITAIESTILASCEFGRCEFISNIDAVVVLTVVIVLNVVVVLVEVGIVVAVAVDVDVAVAVFDDNVVPEAASAFLVLSVANIKETTGGVTTANRPHCSRNDRRSALSCSFFCSSDAI
jgi:hypothetical protein